MARARSGLGVWTTTWSRAATAAASPPVGGEPGPLAGRLQPGAQAVACPARAVGSNHLKGHVREAEPRALGAVPGFEVGLAAQQPAVPVDGGLEVADRDGDVVEAGDHAP